MIPARPSRNLYLARSGLAPQPGPPSPQRCQSWCRKGPKLAGARQRLDRQVLENQRPSARADGRHPMTNRVLYH